MEQAAVLPSDPCAPLGTDAPRPALTGLDVILQWLGPVDGRAILDVGCGRGALARILAARGARVTGIDPLAAAVEEARAAVPEASFQVAGAEALPFADGSFDAVVIMNALHHVPGALMGPALNEAARVSRGPVLVIEPLAGGSFFETMRPVEDETDIRAEAQAALAAEVASGRLRLARAGEYDDLRRFPDVDAFLARVVSVDPSRQEAAARERETVSGLMARWGTKDGDMILFAQPHRAHLLARA